MFIITVAEPLSAFFITMSGLDLSVLSAEISAGGMLFRSGRICKEDISSVKSEIVWRRDGRMSLSGGSQVDFGR